MPSFDAFFQDFINNFSQVLTEVFNAWMSIALAMLTDMLWEAISNFLGSFFTGVGV